MTNKSMVQQIVNLGHRSIWFVSNRPLISFYSAIVNSNQTCRAVISSCLDFHKTSIRYTLQNLAPYIFLRNKYFKTQNWRSEPLNLRTWSSKSISVNKYRKYINITKNRTDNLQPIFLDFPGLTFQGIPVHWNQLKIWISGRLWNF